MTLTNVIHSLVEEVTRDYKVESELDKSIIGIVKAYACIICEKFYEYFLQPESRDVFIDIPLGTKNSELIEVVYFIPEGYNAIVEANKVIIKKKVK